MPRRVDGKSDDDTAKIGTDLVDFVNQELMPYLRDFKQTTAGYDTIEYKIGEIFGEVRNKFGNGYMLREAIGLIDALEFKSQEQKHELSDLYETRIKNMGNAGKNGGQYYTPRPAKPMSIWPRRSKPPPIYARFRTRRFTAKSKPRWPMLSA